MARIKTSPTKRVWRISKSAPMGEWVDMREKPTAPPEKTEEPDEPEIPFAHALLDGTDVIVANADGSSAASITGSVTPTAGVMSWSPDSTELLISLNSDGNILQRVMADGSNMRHLARPGRQTFGADWHAGPRKPVSLGIPSAIGQASTSRSLVASTGHWLGGYFRTTYQWQRCDIFGGNCVDVPGATDRVYRLGVPDYNMRLRFLLTATNGAGSTTVTSVAASPVQTSSATPNNGGSGGSGGGGASRNDLHHQRVHDDKARRSLQREDLHVESTVTLRTRTFVPVLPRLVFR
jgi:hypothetical protein